MEFSDAQARRQEQERQRQRRLRRARFGAGGSLIAFVAVVLAIVVGSGGSSSHASKTTAKRATTSTAASTSGATGKPGTAAVPILAYHVINVAPPGSSAPPTLYVPADQFSAQMDALKAAGWHPITLNQLQNYWSRGTSLGSGKPIVISFDGGYASQFTNALPVLKRLGWVGVANIGVSGLSPADGGLTDSQIRGLIAAGWELDAQGVNHADLTSVSSAQLSSEVANDRQTLRTRYALPVNWFSYVSGRYDPTLTAAVRAAGFVGAVTLEAGWASPQGDRFRLPRLQVVAGTSPTALLAQITAAQGNTSTPSSSSGA